MCAEDRPDEDESGIRIHAGRYSDAWVHAEPAAVTQPPGAGTRRTLLQSNGGRTIVSPG
jgi:hypothetical protein